LKNVANGKLVYVEGSSRDRFQLDPVVNRDGTITQGDTLTGDRQPGLHLSSQVLVKDSGFTSIRSTFDSQGNCSASR